MEPFDIKKFGREGEQIVKNFLKEKGYKIFEIDWIAKKNDDYICVEVKRKTGRFKPPPFEGQGFDVYKINMRVEYETKTSNKQYIIIIEEDTKNILGQWLSILEKGKKFDTAKGIRIYPIESFEIIGNF